MCCGSTHSRTKCDSSMLVARKARIAGPDRMIFIDAERVHALLDYPSLVQAFEQYHRQDIDAVDELLLTQPGQADKPSHFFIRAAWQRQQDLGTKVITVFPDNETVGTGSPTV